MKIELFSRWVVAIMVTGLLTSVSAVAQKKSAPEEPIMIVVTDPSGAIVPHARIEISPASANATEMYSGPDGKLTVRLEPGNYQVTVTEQGFKRWTQQVQVEAGASQIVGVGLKIASNSGVQVDCAPNNCGPVTSEAASAHGEITGAKALTSPSRGSANWDPLLTSSDIEKFPPLRDFRRQIVVEAREVSGRRQT